MTKDRMSNLTTVFMSVIIILSGLLAWFYSQNTVLQSKTEAARSRINELETEVSKLRTTESYVVPAKLSMSNRIGQNEMEMADTSVLPIEVRKNETGLSEKDLSVDDTSDEPVLNMLPDPQAEPDELSLAKDAFAALDYNLAIDNYTQVKTDAEEYALARLGLANALFYSHKYEKAVAEFKNVHALKPDSVDALIGLANSHQRLNQHAARIAAYDKVVELEPQKWLHYNSRASAYLMSNDHVRAEKDFRQAANLAQANPSDEAKALENVGLIYLKEKQWQKAFDHADKVNNIDRQQSWNWLVRGVAAAKLERNVDAYVSFDEWYKYRRTTDPYLLKQLLPESLYQYIDVSPTALARLVDPPFISGDQCENNYQCKSLMCRPGPPSNKQNFCVAEDKVCSAPNSNGYLPGETLTVGDMRVRCYQPEAANARWTPDQGGLN
ncbi:MAG: hypothetical protein GKR93_14405 [Gammaproteobacteria bacterium]|nr:hypothetical protein [Gammaproteobacteria bacterium]